MTPESGRLPPETRRGHVPVWRQALSGIGLVVVLAAAVTAAGALLALVVSLLF